MFDDSDFDIDSYCFFSSYQIAVDKNVKQLATKINLLFSSIVMQFTAFMLGSKVKLAPPTGKICRKA